MLIVRKLSTQYFSKPRGVAHSPPVGFGGCAGVVYLPLLPIDFCVVDRPPSPPVDVFLDVFIPALATFAAAFTAAWPG